MFSAALLIVSDTISWSRDLGWEHDSLKIGTVDTRSSPSEHVWLEFDPRNGSLAVTTEASKIYEALFGKKAWQGDEAHRGAFFANVTEKFPSSLCQNENNE